MLGSNCNFKCRHCIQQEYNNNPVNINNKVFDYIKNYASKNRVTVMFWGGEPLLYLDTIKHIVSVLADSVDYTIVTNGSLINEHFVQFANDNDIAVALSHDGINTKDIRRTDVLEKADFISLFDKIKNKSVNSVISAYNENYQALRKYFNSKLHNISNSVEFLRCTWDMPNDIYNFNENKYAKSVRIESNKAFKDIVEQNITDSVLLFLPYLQKIANHRDSNIYPNCGQIRSNRNIDLQGNIYPCHNTGDVIANINTSEDEIEKAYDKWLLPRLDTNCKNCEVFDLCNYGCPLENKNTVGAKKCCNINKIFFNECKKLASDLEDYLQGVMNKC